MEPGFVEAHKIRGPPELPELKTTSGHEPEKKSEAAVCARSSSTSSRTRSSAPRPHSRNEGQSTLGPVKAGQCKVTEAKAPLKIRTTVDAGTSKKRALSWKTFERDQPVKPEKKLPKMTSVETHKIQRAPNKTRVVKPRGTHVGAKRSPLTSQPAAEQQPAPPKFTSSLVEQQQALGIAFEADEGALNSILTGHGVTAPLLDRTASLNIPTSVYPQSQGLRKGGSAFGTRASVYAPCESRFNLRDGLIPRQPLLGTKHGPKHIESLVPVATPFRESCYRNIYKVAERNSVYVKYVTEEEWRSHTLSRNAQPTPGRMTIATPARVRLGTNRQTTLETPFLEEQSAKVTQAATARSSIRSWRDIFTQREGDPASLHSVAGLGEKPDNLRRTLTFIESETEWPSSDTVSSSSSSVIDSTRLDRPKEHAKATMCRLSEADELIVIEEMERRLQHEIEAMEHAKMADQEHARSSISATLGTEMLDLSGLTATRVDGADLDVQVGIGGLPSLGSEHASLIDVLQQLSLGSSPELAASRLPSSKPKQHGLQQPQEQLAQGYRPATLDVDSALPSAAPSDRFSTPNMPPASLAAKAAESSGCKARPASAAAAAAESTRSGDHRLPAALVELQASQQPPPAPASPLPCEQQPSAVAATDHPAAAPDADAAGLPAAMEVDHGVLGGQPTALRSLGNDPPSSQHESLRSQSRLIATIDRLGGSATAVVDSRVHAAPRSEQEPQLMAQSCHSNATAVGAAASLQGGVALTVATASGTASGWHLWPATVRSPCAGEGTGATTMAAAARPAMSAATSPGSVLLEAEHDLVAQRTPVFRQRAGTISVLDCGVYSPCAGKAAAADGVLTADGEADDVGTRRNGWPVQQHRLATIPPEVLTASRLANFGTTQLLVVPTTDALFAVSASQQPIASNPSILCSDAHGRHPMGCEVSEASCPASNLHPMACGVGDTRCTASADDRGSVCCSPAGLPATAALSAAEFLPVAEARPAINGDSVADTAAANSPPSAFVCAVTSAVARLRPSLSGSASAQPLLLHTPVVAPLPMPLDLVQGCGVDSPPVVLGAAAAPPPSSTSTPELLYQLSLMGLVFNAAERFESALLDEECALYLCRASTRQQHSPLTRELPDPVAVSLTHGDDQHCIPIRETDSEDSSSTTSSQEGSAFRCYTP